MSDEEILRNKAREAIQAGKLPGYPPDGMWGGSGAGAVCTICGKVVERNEVEFELEFARDDAAGRQGTYHVHSRCFAAWESERWALATIHSNGEAQPAPSSALPNGASQSNTGTASSNGLSAVGNGATIPDSDRETPYTGRPR